MKISIAQVLIHNTVQSINLVNRLHRGQYLYLLLACFNSFTTLLLQPNVCLHLNALGLQPNLNFEVKSVLEFEFNNDTKYNQAIVKLVKNRYWLKCLQLQLFIAPPLSPAFLYQLQSVTRKISITGAQ